jgi:hypothetical protein
VHSTGPMYLFSVVFILPPSNHGSVWLLPVIAGTGLPIHITGELRGNQKENERGPLSIATRKSFLLFIATR